MSLVASANAEPLRPSSLEWLLGEEASPLRLGVSGPRSLGQVLQEFATGSQTAVPPGSDRLPTRIRENARRLSAAHAALAKWTRDGVPAPAEAEWLIDNYYVVEDVAREIRRDLPRSYYRELPALASGPLAGVPRVYPLAAIVLASTDSLPSEPALNNAVQAFQEVSTLTTGELWALPIMLRVALLENLRRLADDITRTVEDRLAAREAVRQAGGGGAPTLPAQPRDAYAAGVIDALRDNEPPAGPAADKLAEWVARHAADFGAIRQREYLRQASNQVSIGNAITTLRLLGIIDWPTFIEGVSGVEKLLRNDPGGSYRKQEFPTRDRCRKAVEELAHGSKRGEAEVARLALAAARGRGGDPSRGHVAYHLIGPGRRDLERQLHYTPTGRAARRRWILGHAHGIYFGLLIGLTAGLLGAIFLVTGPMPLGWALLTALAALLPASELAVGIVNYLGCRLVPATVLPKLDFRHGLAPDAPTFLVIPTLISRPDQAEGLADRLEQHFLSNPDAQFRFALLTDFTDSPTETKPTDAACLDALRDAVAALNARHAPDGPPLFFALHRKRLFNPSEGAWMGWERKRGKLGEFNQLLRGATNTGYVAMFPEAPPAAVNGHPFRYVLTLDTDTVLPQDAARQMVATLAHPLNRPVVSEDGRRVVAGYAVLQPRVSFLYKTGFRSWFGRLFAGSAGVDPYSAAVSDTYMDLFGRGTFTGKGLYDLDAFEATAGHAFPENAILSHDLIESNYARCALATDVQVFDEFPPRYHAYARREHRWIRGDWQLLPWLFPTVPTPGGREPNVLGLLERWKIADNLRRSLVPAGSVLLLLLGWTVLPGSPWFWTLLAIAPIWLPLGLLLFGMTSATLRGNSPVTLVSRGRNDLLNTAGQAALLTTFLANQAWIAADAVLRTLGRLFVSKRKLLEWETADAAAARLGGTAWSFVRTMWPSWLLGAAALGLAIAFAPERLAAAVPLTLVWFLAPFVAYAVSRPRDVSEPPLSPEQQGELRQILRRTWGFFTTFVGPEDNWLPPDNFQEEPLGIVARRTSPTNIGLYFLVVIAAHRRGYATAGEVVERLHRAFDALDELPKYKGHLFNWYATDTLKSLPPDYVSTVDSGNFLACLLAAKHGLAEVAAKPWDARSATAGLDDTLSLVALEWAKSRGKSPADGAAKIDGAIRDLRAAIDAPDAVGRVPELAEELERALKAGGTPELAEVAHWARELTALARRHQAAAEQADASAPALRDQLSALAGRADALAAGMEFGFLYNRHRELFSIGFNLVTGRLDGFHYDLLASEACITSFLAVARGEVPKKHWFHLGRLTSRVKGNVGLVSWGGTLFEYLMPRLLLPVPPGVLLDRGQKSAVERQQEYGNELGLPWGISESGYFAFHTDKSYQYMSFGAPGMGLKRGLDKYRVVAPYATLMAVDVDPSGALANLRRLRAEGGEGRHGFYEAIDYTPEHLPVGVKRAVVRSHMAHHQGMGFLAIVNRLDGGAVREWMRAEPAVRAAELLLEERVPTEVPPYVPEEPAGEAREAAAPNYPVRRRIASPDTPTPRPHRLSNGRYSVLLTNAGAGGSQFRELAVTRWRPDATSDALGQWAYLRDRKSGAVWSAGYQPTLRRPAFYEVTFSADKAEVKRLDDGIESLLEVCVVPDQDVELRRLTLVNVGNRPRELDVTSYAEIVLATPAADLAHPAFGKLFVETEWLADPSALLARRRPRGPGEPPTFALHVAASELPAGSVSYETDRRAFLGRRGDPAFPAALKPDVDRLAGGVGAVLDPVVCLRVPVKLKPGERATVAFSTAVAPSREAALQLADQYHTLDAVARGFDLAWAHANIELRHEQLKPEESHLFQRLGGHLTYPTGPLRLAETVEAPGLNGQPDLWRLGISGDHPICLARIHTKIGVALAFELVRAHAHLTGKGQTFDLVLWVEGASGYLDELVLELIALVRSQGRGDRLDRPGGVFVRKGGQGPLSERELLLAAARVVLNDERGPLATQVDGAVSPRLLPPRRGVPLTRPRPGTAPKPEGLRLANAHGGFTPDGREYVLVTGADAPTPAPWSNVLANPHFGTLVTEAGGGCTWAGNSQLNRLSPWGNDAALDAPGEVLTIVDEATGAAWGPTPLPHRLAGPCLVRHGQGYTVWERTVEGVRSALTVFVPTDEPVKVFRLELANEGGELRTLSLDLAVDWVLGTTREATAATVVTDVDAETGALFARNAFGGPWKDAVAFLDTSLRPRSVTGDRAEYLGRNRPADRPAALERVGLSGRVGAGLDPIGAVRAAVDLEPGETRVVLFVLGQAANRPVARLLVEKYRSVEAADAALAAVRAFWDGLCGTLTVRTPDEAFNILVNRWLPYQILSCRVWGRTAFYQSGGAWGFRDQLQDVLALLDSEPAVAREHLLRAAGRQFPEGDVQHWWHEPKGDGVRTRFCDDFLWLPYAVGTYVERTGDAAVLDETAPYLDAPHLTHGEHESYTVPVVGPAAGKLYEHSRKALDFGARFGERGLPLMGTGDWNDGMNLVGAGGKGESVWAAWFQIACLDRMIPLAERRGEVADAARWRGRRNDLRRAAEEHAWDGGWYRRAFADDGTALGSASSPECRIDSLPQTWAVLSGAADGARALKAVAATWNQLVKERERLILLFAPPFDQWEFNPGYIKGYLPGVRENGGQYTHAAAWVVAALARTGRPADAWAAFAMLNPASHARTAAEAERYRGEPYAAAGDVYGAGELAGVAGWTWYTGSAGWLFRVAAEELLGLRRRGEFLSIEPKLPPEWPGVEFDYRYGRTLYRIQVRRAAGAGQGNAVVRVLLGEEVVQGGAIRLTDDGGMYDATVELG